MTRFCLALALAGIVASSVSASEPTATTAASQPIVWQPFLNAKPAAGVGKWLAYDLRMPRLVGGDATCMWFCSSGFVWRYEVKTRRIESWSTLDGLPMPGSYYGVPLASDGQGGCTMWARGDAVYRWTPKTGWRRLPEPVDKNSDPPEIRFDRQGEMYTKVRRLGEDKIYGTAIMQWREGQWREVAFLERWVASHFCPAEDGFLLSFERKVYLLPVKGTAKEVWLLPPWTGGTFDTFDAFEPVGRRVLCATRRGLRFEYSKGLTQLQPLDAAITGVDLASDGYLRKVVGADKKTRLVADDVAAVDVPFADEVLVLGLAFRDANKDFWVCDRRWDGKQWQQVAPDGQMSQQLPWVFDNPLMFFQDVTDRALWRQPRYASRNAGGLQLVKVDDWQVTVTQSIKPAYGGGRFLTHLIDPKGRVWGYTCGQTSGGNSYPLPFCMLPDGTIRKFDDKDFTPARISPAGEVWFKGDGFLVNGRTAGRYNEETGKIDVMPKDAALEAMSIRCGDLTLAPSLDDMNGCLYEKVGGEWKPMRSLDGRSGRGSMSMVCGDRLLVTIMSSNDGGVWEFDLTNKRRIPLLRSYGLAYFDRKGRRVMEGLIFDGDPFETEKGLKDLAAADRKLLADLLKRLDADDYKTREAAMEEIRANGDRLGAMIPEAAGREDLSMEVRTRLKTLSEELNSKGAIRTPDLFRRMHPTMRPASTATRPATAPT